MHQIISSRLVGTVSTFDDGVGLGSIVDPRGHRLAFHCVSLTDGSRQVNVGQTVEFSIAFCVARSEAVDIVKT